MDPSCKVHQTGSAITLEIQKHCQSQMASKLLSARHRSSLTIMCYTCNRSLGFWLSTATEDRPAVCCLLQHFVTVCRPTGGMTAVPSREVTTSQVSAVTFGFYTEKEVLLLLKLRVRTVVPSRQSNCKLHTRRISHYLCRNNSHRLTMGFTNFVDPHRCAN